MSMALSETDILRKEEGADLDLLGANYYKLPFCDEDIKQFGQNMENNTEDWVNSMLEDRFMNGNNQLLTPPSPSSSSGALSPSSNSSSSSSGNGTTEHAYSLINDRPDTPLTAVKFEEFSSADYQLDDFDYASMAIKEEYSPSFIDDSFSLQQSPRDEDSNFAFNTSEFTFDSQKPTQVAKPSLTVSGSHYTMDRSLASTIEAMGNNVITISKMGNAVHVKKEVEPEEPMDYSLCRQQTQCTQPTPLEAANATSRSKASTFRIQGQNNILTLASDVAQLSPASDDDHALYLAQAPDHNDPCTTKSTQPTAKVMTDALTQRTQIRIPTSTLQTILKSGRLITKLQQEGQFLPRIKIKTEPIDGEQQYVRICQPQIDVQLPPTPPSSNTSDNEGSSSPGGGMNGISSDAALQLSSSLHVMSSGSQMSTQLLTSPQRLTQSHGPLHLTEEEKRTLVSEGYPVPDKLPLTKTEEKALKKIRRKIKNKISAQESRRKKKEYVEALERRMESYNQENGDLRRKLDSLEDSNQTLLGQLRSLQMLVAEKMPKPSRTVTTQTSSCLMVVVLCFAVFLGGWLPFLSPFLAKDSMYPSLGGPAENARSWRSRVLLSYPEETWEAQGYCDNTGCHKATDFESASSMAPKDASNEVVENEVDGGGDTYDEPSSGRVVMNDTKDQIGQIIANTMEPRDVAAVLASRKMAQRGRAVPMAAVEVVVPDNKKYVPVTNAVTE